MEKSLTHRFGRMFMYIAAAWVFLWVLTPLIVERIPALKYYGEICEENNIFPGALYYTDVPVTPDAEQNNRDTVRFLPRGGQIASR